MSLSVPDRGRCACGCGGLAHLLCGPTPLGLSAGDSITRAAAFTQHPAFALRLRDGPHLAACSAQSGLRGPCPAMEQPLVATAAPGGSCFTAVTVAGIVPVDPDVLFKVGLQIWVSACASCRVRSVLLPTVAAVSARWRTPQVFADPARTGKGVFTDVKVRP